MAQTKQDGITLRQWLPLIGLTCCAFVFNTSEFMPIGLLTDIAASFSLTEAQAGIMISVYAWGVMLLSLPLMVFASRFEFKRMLLGVLAVFSLGQFLSAVAPTYPILVCARLVVACAHAVFWSVASIMASRLVDTRHGALAISMIATGSSIAQIFGLPLGRAIGLAVGWRMTFAVVGGLSAIAVVYQAAVFPAMPAGERFTVKQLPELLKNPLLIALYAVTVFMATGYYASYSYIEPFLAQVAHVDAGRKRLIPEDEDIQHQRAGRRVGRERAAECLVGAAAHEHRVVGGSRTVGPLEPYAGAHVAVAVGGVDAVAVGDGIIPGPHLRNPDTQQPRIAEPLDPQQGVAAQRAREAAAGDIVHRVEHGHLPVVNEPLLFEQVGGPIDHIAQAGALAPREAGDGVLHVLDRIAVAVEDRLIDVERVPRKALGREVGIDQKGVAEDHRQLFIGDDPVACAGRRRNGSRKQEDAQSGFHSVKSRFLIMLYTVSRLTE